MNYQFQILHKLYYHYQNIKTITILKKRLFKVIINKFCIKSLQNNDYHLLKNIKIYVPNKKVK